MFKTGGICTHTHGKVVKHKPLNPPQQVFEQISMIKIIKESACSKQGGILSTQSSVPHAHITHT